MKIQIVFVFLVILGFRYSLYAQTPVADTAKIVQILDARRLSFKKINDTSSLQILAGNVKLRQGTALFYCDSCIINKQANVFEAFGNVHINDNDTTNIYSNYLRYFIDKRQAYLKGNVKLTDGHATLTTPELDYNMVSNIGTYTKGGKVVNGKSVLTSKEGVYYADLRDVYFKKNVDLKDPAYSLKADSLLYNTELQTARFISNTYLRDTSGRVIRTTEGYYELRSGRAQFTQRTTIVDHALTVIGDQIANDDSSGVIQIRGRGVMRDTAQGIAILANEIFVNKKTEAYLATVKPLMIVKQEKDSIYITADTLFSARLTDLRKVADTSVKQNTDTLKKSFQDSLVKANTLDSVAIKTSSDTLVNKDISVSSMKTNSLTSNNHDSLAKKDAAIKKQFRLSNTETKKAPSKPGMNKKPGGIKKEETNKSDSTNRYFEAFRNVRVFSDSIQTISDSLFYSFKDSTFQLFQKPVVWSKGSQITGDTIYLFTKNKKADRIKVFENSFLINEIQPGFYNQVKSSRLDAYFAEGVLDSARAKGSAESIYFLQDEDSAYSGINQTSSDIMDVFFKENQLSRVVFRRSVKGTLWPIKQKQPSEMRLPNFQWLEDRRPKTKYELFE
ncbi:OstA family protein [Chitinophagaceae bacterium LB-8]|uniref:OstA family protein n=1 Tax=Paraflavisolibacter caeni TaxID=2982496 RepID=A0A9X2XWZ9_9BACT|nr:OstA-like protein [Paraflavisolibacter caeni]MCU7550261.1 OstA family protein [Paraflavisolibacter caeni]